jgi:serine/threonine protein kinase
LLLDSRGHIKLIDFGFSKKIDNTKTWTMCGTPEYIAPEVLLSKGHDNAADWWSLGVLIYEMLSGHPPFHGDNNYSVFEKILAGNISTPPYFDRHAADIIRALLHTDPAERLGTGANGAADIKAHPWFADIDWRALESRHIACGPINPALHLSASSDGAKGKGAATTNGNAGNVVPSVRGRSLTATNTENAQFSDF